MATQAERIAALEKSLAAALAKINEICAVMQPLAEQVQGAHARLDTARKVFNDLRRAVTPKREPQRTSRHAPHEFDLKEFNQAVADLRADAEEIGSTQRYFPREHVLVRARALRTLKANREAAAAAT